MEAKKTIATLIFVVVASVVLTNVIYDYLTVVDSKELKMYLTVSDYVGFNVDPSALFFGTTLKGGKASRDVIVTNDFNLALKVDIHAFGELTKWVYVSDNGFLLQPDENKTVKVSVAVPKDVNFGNYTGILKISFRKF
jgi:hypothetical protein